MRMPPQWHLATGAAGATGATPTEAARCASASRVKASHRTNGLPFAQRSAPSEKRWVVTM